MKVVAAKMGPGYRGPSSKMIKRQLLLEKDAAEKLLTEELSAVENVALTADLWTCGQTRSYMVVTVHYVNQKAESVDKILHF